MKTNATNKSGKGALGFVFSVVLLDVMGSVLLLTRVKVRADGNSPINAHSMAD